MCIISQEKECGRAILSTKKIADDLVLITNEMRTDIAVFKNSFADLSESVEKLIKKHEEEENNKIKELKEELKAKEEDMKAREELARTKKWQVKLLAISTAFGFISTLAMFIISLM